MASATEMPSFEKTCSAAVTFSESTRARRIAVFAMTQKRHDCALASNFRRYPLGRLLHRHALREVAGFVHIAAEFVGDVVGEHLERDHAQDRGEVEGRVGDENHLVADFAQRGVAFGADGDDRAFAGFDFLDVAEVFFQTLRPAER